MPGISTHLPGLALSSLAAASKERSHTSPHPSVSSTSSASRSTRSMSPHSQSTRSFSPHSRSERSMSPGSVFSMSSPPPTPSRRSVTPISQKRETTPQSKECASTSSSTAEQISPDVNSNTKLLNKDDCGNISSKDTDNTTTKESASESSIEKDVKIEAMEVDTTTTPDDGTKDETASSTKYLCQYCNEQFENPITQHQHERYLCKLNKDILHHRSQVESCQSPHSTVSDLSHVESTTNGSIGNASDEEEEELYKDADSSFDERNMRIRTQFTEEQQIYLKSQYLLNPRPRKFELIRMGNKIGFPKRVVQVWFQNMRARERKYGREPAMSVAALRLEGRDSDISRSSTYIPNVPKPFSTLLSVSNQAHKLVKESSSPEMVKGKHGEIPLDLTVHRSPPLAHGGSSSRHSTPESTSTDQVLNLSLKKESSEEPQSEKCESREQSVDSIEREQWSEKMQRDQTDNAAANGETAKKVTEETDKSSSDELLQKTFQDSPIFKYMQQEGMFLNKQLPHLASTITPSLALSMQSQILQHTMASVLKLPGYKPNTDLTIPHTSASSLLFDTARTVAEQSASPPTGTTSCSSPTQNSPVYTLDTEHQSPALSVATSLPYLTTSLPEDTHNLATLAEAAQQAATIMSGKPKRMRKKTWRQVDCYVRIRLVFSTYLHLQSSNGNISEVKIIISVIYNLSQYFLQRKNSS